MTTSSPILDQGIQLVLNHREILSYWTPFALCILSGEPSLVVATFCGAMAGTGLWIGVEGIEHT